MVALCHDVVPGCWLWDCDLTERYATSPFLLFWMIIYILIFYTEFSLKVKPFFRFLLVASRLSDRLQIYDHEAKQGLYKWAPKESSCRDTALDTDHPTQSPHTASAMALLVTAHYFWETALIMVVHFPCWNWLSVPCPREVAGQVPPHSSCPLYGEKCLSPGIMCDGICAKCWQQWGSGNLQDKRHFLQVRLLLLRRWCKTVYFIRYLFKSFNYISCFHSLYFKGIIVWLNERLPPANFIVQTAWSSLGLKYISRSGLNVCGKWRETLETKEALTQVLKMSVHTLAFSKIANDPLKTVHCSMLIKWFTINKILLWPYQGKYQKSQNPVIAHLGKFRFSTGRLGLPKSISLLHINVAVAKIINLWNLKLTGL